MAQILFTCTMHCVMCTVVSLVCSLHANYLLWCVWYTRKYQDLSNLQAKFKSALEFYSKFRHFVLTTTIFITIITMLIIILHSAPKTRTATFQSTHPNPWCSWQIPTRCQGSSNIQTYFIPWLVHRCFSYFIFHIIFSYFILSYFQGSSDIQTYFIRWLIHS